MMERNIKLVIEYDGTNYFGWQRQVGQMSVQEALENAIQKLTQEDVRVTAAGRTDAGVHARGQVVNFRMHKMLPVSRIKMALNAWLPDDIVIKDAEEVDAGFNSRFDAKKRIYQYFILFEKSAVYRNCAWQFYHKADTSLLSPMAEMVLGRHDFGAFCRLNVQANHKMCQVYVSRWFQKEDFLVYRIEANRFLHGMVRTLVGTMMDAARGRFTPEQFGRILASGDRTLGGTTAPARGLFLEEVVYTED